MAYYRDSGFDSDLRIVFLKLQATIAAVIGISKFLSSTTIRGRIGHGLATVVILFYVVVISESRLSMLSIGLTCILAFLFVLRGRQRVLAFIGGVAGAVVVVPYVINKYLGEFTTWDNYMANDVSASFRQIEYQHFMAFFYKTYGIGFGFMGRAPDKDNILAFAGHYGGWLYGTQDYGLNPDDNGLWAALYQYGYHGFALVVFMTLFMAIALIRVSVITRGYIVAGFLGCFVISQLMSPVPLNFFTLEYSGYIGGLIWFMAAQCDLIRKRVVAFTEFGADPATRNNRRRTLPSTRRSI
jgi:O-antigen ligase